MYYWGKPQFFGVRAAAANIACGQGNYTVEDFRADYPQFFNKEGYFLGSLPMLEQIIRMANGSIQPDRWLDGWRYAVGLYVAHYATLSLRGYAESNETPQQAAASGALVGMVKSAALGDASVTYDTAAKRCQIILTVKMSFYQLFINIANYIKCLMKLSCRKLEGNHLRRYRL